MLDKLMIRMGLRKCQPILFWQMYDNIQNLKVIRRQTSGLCFMHAPAVLQHYLCSIESSGAVVGRSEIYFAMLQRKCSVRLHYQRRRGEFSKIVKRYN
jgi:hypothetical protein